MPKYCNETFENTEFAKIILHLLRHSCASIPHDLGFTEVTIAALPGQSAGFFRPCLCRSAADVTQRKYGILAIVLRPALRDLNDDLPHLGLHELRAAVRVQLVPEEVPRFWSREPIGRRDESWQPQKQISTTVAFFDICSARMRL